MTDLARPFLVTLVGLPLTVVVAYLPSFLVLTLMGTNGQCETSECWAWSGRTYSIATIMMLVGLIVVGGVAGWVSRTGWGGFGAALIPLVLGVVLLVAIQDPNNIYAGLNTIFLAIVGVGGALLLAAGFAFGRSRHKALRGAPLPTASSGRDERGIDTTQRDASR